MNMSYEDCLECAEEGEGKLLSPGGANNIIDVFNDRHIAWKRPLLRQ